MARANLTSTKGHLISKSHFGFPNSSKKQPKTIRSEVSLVMLDTLGWFFLFVFLEELSKPKSSFEIKWPLQQHQSTYSRGPESALIEIPLSDPNLLSKRTSECEHCETRFS